jgi:transcriptional regulator of arginine metabolism
MDRHQESRLQRPATRAARLSAIEQALMSHIVTSQSQLSTILADEGIDVTQATLSRDLDEINAGKARLADGTMAYALEPAEADRDPALDERRDHVDAMARAEQQLSKVLSGLVVSVAHAHNLIVVHTPSGAAQYVASVIDRQPLDAILGSIAGDDTVMLVCAEDDIARDFSQWMLGVASRAK